MFDRYGVLRGAVLLSLALALLLPMRLAAVPPLDGPRVFLLNPEALAAAKAAVARRDPAVLPAWDALRGEADKALTVNRFSVVDKGVAPPSGDKHDYMRYGLPSGFAGSGQKYGAWRPTAGSRSNWRAPMPGVTATAIWTA